MIFTDRKITIRNGKSTINEPVILYRGDYEVSIRFTIMESKFRFKSGVNLVDSEKASHGQLAILAPYGGNVFSEIVKCEDGTVTFTLTKEMIDQLEEVGLYSFQIRLFDYYRESRVSIPPVEFGIEVREPVASEDHDNEVNNAIVGYSIAKVVDPSKENVGDTFDANGNYNKTDWETGDRITEGKLNKIEDAIDQINQNEKNDVTALDKRVSSNYNILNNTKADKTNIDNIQQQINNLVLGAVGDGNNAEVIQARGTYETLNDRITNVEVVKSYDDITPMNDISSGLSKSMNFQLNGFNGTDLVNIPVDTFKGETKVTVLLKFSIDVRSRLAIKIFDDTWGHGKVVHDLGDIHAGVYKCVQLDIDVSGYQSFMRLRLSQIGTDNGGNVNIVYLKIVPTKSMMNIGNFDEIFTKLGDSDSYIIPKLKVLPSNMIELLGAEEIPTNTLNYIDKKTQGAEALRIFDCKAFEDYLYDREIPRDVMTNEGNGTLIVQIPLTDINHAPDELTFIIRYKLKPTTSCTTYALRVFDNDWGPGVVRDLGGNNILNKEYTVAYSFNKKDINSFILFRFSRIGASGEVHIAIDYAKLIPTESFTSIDEINNLHDSLGKLEEYPVVNFKMIPSNLEDMLITENKNVVMIGDSIANQFAAAICAHHGLSEYNFMNKCIGGESTLDTMARLGAIPYVILPPFTIPAGITKSGTPNIASSLFVKSSFDSSTGTTTWSNGYLSSYAANPNGLNPYSSLKCDIAGVEGTLYFERASGSTYFIRDTAGNSVVIDRPTVVTPIGASAYDKDAVYTCFMGTNEGWCNRFFESDRTTLVATKKDAELLFSYYKQIAQYINTNKFLFMGFYMCAFLDQQAADTRIEFWEYFEELMAKEFGNKYFSVRKYLREIGYKDANVSLTSNDVNNILSGQIPITASTGTTNGVHVTGRIAACVANEILKRLKSLGYIDSYNAIDVTKYDNGQSSVNPDDYV